MPGSVAGKRRFKGSHLTNLALAILVLTGVVSFVAGVLGKNPLRAWQAYLVNFLFWTGLSCGALVFVAVLNIVGARWGRPLKRFAEAFGAFLPVAFVLFWILYFGRMELFPWIKQPVPDRAVWLNVPFLFARDGGGLLLLTVIALTMIFFSVKGDSEWSASQANSRDATGEDKSSSPWLASWRKQKTLSPILVIAYTFVLTLIGFDLIMALDAHWYSTLLGGYFLVGSFYAGVAALYLIALVMQRTLRPNDYQGERHFHDLGKLTLAFCLFTGYLFYAQFLTIWYGNLPAETRYVILRVKLTPWEPLAWVVLFMIFLIPFFVLLSRRIKLKRVPMILLCLMILTGMWLEKLILVAPSLWRQNEFPLGFTEILITAGYFGASGLCFKCFLSRVPLMPVSDPLFREMIELRQQRLEP